MAGKKISEASVLEDVLLKHNTRMLCPKHKRLCRVVGYRSHGHTLECGCVRRTDISGNREPTAEKLLLTWRSLEKQRMSTIHYES